MLASSLRAALLDRRYACVLVLASSAAAYLPGCCAAFACEDYMAISGTISRPAAQQLHLDVLVCKSEACGNVLLTSAALASGEDSASATLELDGSGSFECTLTRRRETCQPGEVCTGQGGYWRLEMVLEGVDIEEGEEDVYELVIVDTDTGETLVERTEAVRYYDGAGDSATCGRDCQSGDEIQFTTEPE